jgi:hypothetical protein
MARVYRSDQTAEEWTQHWQFGLARFRGIAMGGTLRSTRGGVLDVPPDVRAKLENSDRLVWARPWDLANSRMGVVVVTYVHPNGVRLWYSNPSVSAQAPRDESLYGHPCGVQDAVHRVLCPGDDGATFELSNTEWFAEADNAAKGRVGRTLYLIGQLEEGVEYYGQEPPDPESAKRVACPRGIVHPLHYGDMWDYGEMQASCLCHSSLHLVRLAEWGDPAASRALVERSLPYLPLVT